MYEQEVPVPGTRNTQKNYIMYCTVRVDLGKASRACPSAVKRSTFPTKRAHCFSHMNQIDEKNGNRASASQRKPLYYYQAIYSSWSTHTVLVIDTQYTSLCLDHSINLILATMGATIFLNILLLTLSSLSLTLATFQNHSERNSIVDHNNNDNSTTTTAGVSAAPLVGDGDINPSNPQRHQRLQLQHHDIVAALRPKMYTYFERIPMEHRFTDMSDEDDQMLLDYWKESWEAAGWEPVVLGLKDAQSHPRFSEYEAMIKALQLEDFYAISLRRYIAMATTISSLSSSGGNNNTNTNNAGGGWMCDYDVFPIRDFRNEPLPHGGEFTVHGTVPATLASGSAVHWEKTLQALLDNAKQHMPPVPHSVVGNELEVVLPMQIVFQRNLWSDTLGLAHLLRNATTRVHSFRFVMAGSMLVSDPPPWDPTTFCTKRQFRKKYRVVHMNVQSLLTAASPSLPSQRLPKHRAAVARQVVPLYEKYCGVKIREDSGDNATNVK
jgi:hypothetical protein